MERQSRDSSLLCVRMGKRRKGKSPGGIHLDGEGPGPGRSQGGARGWLGGPQKHVCGGLGTTLPGVREARSGREAAPVRRIVGRHVLSETRVAVVRGCRF